MKKFSKNKILLLTALSILGSSPISSAKEPLIDRIKSLSTKKKIGISLAAIVPFVGIGGVALTISKLKRKNTLQIPATLDTGIIKNDENENTKITYKNAAADDIIAHLPCELVNNNYENIPIEIRHTYASLIKPKDSQSVLQAYKWLNNYKRAKAFTCNDVISVIENKNNSKGSAFWNRMSSGTLRAIFGKNYNWYLLEKTFPHYSYNQQAKLRIPEIKIKNIIKIDVNKFLENKCKLGFDEKTKNECSLVGVFNANADLMFPEFNDCGVKHERCTHPNVNLTILVCPDAIYILFDISKSDCRHSPDWPKDPCLFFISID